MFCWGHVGLPSWGCDASGFLGPEEFLVFAMGPPLSGRACGLPQSMFVMKTFLPSGGLGSCTSCGVPYLWLALCSSACVSPGGCPSFSGWSCAIALGSSSLDLVCVGASTVYFSYVFLWVNSVFLSLLITNEGLHWWLFLSDIANHFWGRVVVFLRPPVCRHFLWLVAALLPGL